MLTIMAFLTRRQDLDSAAFVAHYGYLAWARAVFAPGTGERVAEDEARFLERARTRAFVVDERVTTPAPTV
jgi:hypothetical protein